MSVVREGWMLVKIFETKEKMDKSALLKHLIIDGLQENR